MAFTNSPAENQNPQIEADKTAELKNETSAALAEVLESTEKPSPTTEISEKTHDRLEGLLDQMAQSEIVKSAKTAEMLAKLRGLSGLEMPENVAANFEEEQADYDRSAAEAMLV